MSLRDEIKQVLNPPYQPFEIIQKFNEWSHHQHDALMDAADDWLLRLYEIDAHFFMSFLLTHIPQNNPELIKEVIKRAEADGYLNLFLAYYAQLPQETINQEITHWIAQKLSPDDIAMRIRARFNYHRRPVLSEASLIALYEYHPQILEVQLVQDVFWQSHNVDFEKGNSYTKFRELVNNAKRHKASSHRDLVQGLFQRFASIDEKRVEAKRIIETAPNWAKAEAQLNALAIIFNQDELEAIQKRFSWQGKRGENKLLAFLFNNSNTFAKSYIQKEITKAKTEPQMEVVVNDLRNRLNWHRFYQMMDAWLLPVYELAPTLCLSLVKTYHTDLGLSKEIASALLTRVQQRNHREMLPHVYAALYDEAEWNAALLKAIQSDNPLREKTMALEDLDCQELYYNQKRAYLHDEVAAAIYRASPAYTQSFILHNLASGNTYPLLLEAAKGTDEYYLIFRQVADGSMWKAEMQALLERDIPADQIETELERYQLNRSTRDRRLGTLKDMDARILKGFIDKYGEAVLPFFERYVRWATPGRLKSLLALDIDRAELLRELTVMARREPQAFSTLSDIWALPLYERGASFFESFLIRYLGRQNEYVTRQLLARARADKRVNLFRALYQLVVTGEEWNKEFAQFLNEAHDDKALDEFIELHDIVNWNYTLSENVATKLYQRNPDKYFSFIARHLSQQNRWGQQISYDKLLKVSEANPEHHLALLKNLAYEKYWQSQIKALLKSDLSGTEAAERLQVLHPRNTWEIRDTSIISEVLDKYGAAVTPYIVKHIQWVGHSPKMMEKLERFAPNSLFWQAVFETIHWHNNENWSNKRWTRALEDILKEDLTDNQVRASLEMLSPEQSIRWSRYEISESIALKLYQKYPDAARGYIQRYYAPNFDDFTFFELAQERHDEEMLDFLSFKAMSEVNRFIHLAFPRHPEYTRPHKQAQETIKRISARIIERFEALHQREPKVYVRHAASMLSWWRPFAIWNASDMVEHNPIYRHIVSEHINAWMDAPEAIREVLESPNIFVQLIALNLLRNAQHELVAQRIVENKRIFRQLLLGRARLSTKRMTLACIERAIALNPAFAPELLPILEEAADFYGKLALSEEMMISITRIKYALEQNLPLTVSR